MEEKKCKIEITQGEYKCLMHVIRDYATQARASGYGDVADRLEVLFTRIDNQIDEQGGFEA